MTYKKIAILRGDGIGPEVMHETLRVLKVITDKYNHHFDYLEASIGGDAYERYAMHCPDETLQICKNADAILFGSVGGPIHAQEEAKWKNCETNSILKLRKYFNLSINIRPIIITKDTLDQSPLKNKRIINGVNCIIFRELTGGLYFGKHAHMNNNPTRIALDECIYNETQIAGIAHAAFKAAISRKQKVCSVDKANVLASSQLWREVLNDVKRHYPSVALTHMLVDNCAMQLVLNPEQFDVIVTENLFGDILSDLASALTGSLGLIPSASINEQGFALYEPAGGSAPDIAGKGIANPSAQLLSAAMMLRQSFNMQTEACLIEEALQKTIAKGIMTLDLCNEKAQAVTTQEFVDAVITEMKHGF